MSGRSRRPGSNQRALPWRTALLVGLAVGFVPWELDTPRQAPVGSVGSTGPVDAIALEEDAHEVEDEAAPSSAVAAPAAPTGAKGSKTPPEVLGAGPGLPAVIDATPASYSDSTH